MRIQRPLTVGRLDLLRAVELAKDYRQAVKSGKPFDVVTELASQLDEALRAFDWEDEQA